MAYVDFLSSVHKKTSRDYLARVNDPEYPKAKAAVLAKQWAYDYWDGDRRINYGGYRYDGRWVSVAQEIINHYGLIAESRVLDIGCGKGFIVHDLMKLVPGLDARGIDVSEYAIENAMPEVKDRLTVAHARELPFEDDAFDLAISINTLHNLHCYDLDPALREMERVARQKYICVESYRNEDEKANLLYWQVTCEAFNTPEEWDWWFQNTGYSGDHSFIYFE